MVGIKISELPASLTPALDYSFPASRDGVTEKLTIQQVADLVTALIVDGSPSSLDTLNELAAALADDANFATTITNALAAKANSATTYTKAEVDAKSKRNIVLNGDMSVAQTGTSFPSPASGSYTIDGWIVAWQGAAVAVNQVAGPAGFRKAQRLTGVAGNTQANYSTRIEAADTGHFVGRPCAIQANIQVSSAQTVKWELQHPNVENNWGDGVTVIASGTWNATTTAQTFTAVTGNLPAGAANGLNLNVYPNNGGAFTSGTISVTGVQVERSDVATGYEHLNYSEQLHRCQRYCFVKEENVTLAGLTAGAGPVTVTQNMNFPTTMRAAPSVTYTYADLGNMPSDGGIATGPTGCTFTSFTFTTTTSMARGQYSNIKFFSRI
jgi:hypothetical protein